MDCQQRRDERPYLQAAIADHHEAWFQPMGFQLRIVSNSRAVIEAAEASFGLFGPALPSDARTWCFVCMSTRSTTVPQAIRSFGSVDLWSTRRRDGIRFWLPTGKGAHLAIFRAQRSRIRPFPGGIFSIWRCSSCWSGVASSAFTERRSARTAGRCSSAAERPGQEHPHLRGRPRPLPGPGGGRGLDRFEQRPMVGHSFVIPSASRRQKLFPSFDRIAPSSS